MTAKRGRSLHTMGQAFVSGLDGGGLRLFKNIERTRISAVSVKAMVVSNLHRIRLVSVRAMEVANFVHLLRWIRAKTITHDQ